MIRAKTATSDLSAAGLGLLAGLAGYVCWRLGVLPELFPRFAIESANTHALELLLNAPAAAAVIAVFSIAIAVVLNRFGLRRSWSYLLFAIAVGCSAALMAAHFLKTPLLALPLLFSGALTILLVQVSRLWQVDRVLSSTLFTSPSGPGEQITDGHILRRIPYGAAEELKASFGRVPGEPRQHGGFDGTPNDAAAQKKRIHLQGL